MGGGYRRPLNPKLLPHLVTKARPAKAAALARQTRRLVVQTANLCGEVDDLLTPRIARRRTRKATRSPSIMAQSAPGPAGVAAQLRHQAVVQRWRKRF
jgi:hypothetical protein